MPHHFINITSCDRYFSSLGIEKENCNFDYLGKTKENSQNISNNYCTVSFGVFFIFEN